MCNEFEYLGNILNAKITIDDENIVKNIYTIIELYFKTKYKMNGDVFKSLQDILYDYKLYDKIEKILKDIQDDVEYIPEIQCRKKD